MTDHTVDEKIQLLSFNVSPYRSDNGFEVNGLIGLVLSLVVAGAALGWLANFISQWFYLILIFPLGIGVALAALGTILIKHNRIRNPLMTGLAGLLGGVLAMFVMHYCSYVDFAKSFDKDLTTELREVAKIDGAEREAIIAGINNRAAQKDAIHFFQGVEASKSFTNYMDYGANSGVAIGRATRPDDEGVNLGYYGSIIYWLIEILIVAVATFLATKNAAREPYCVGCRRWKNSKFMGFLSGDRSAIKSSISTGRVKEWLGFRPSLNYEKDSIAMTRYTCPVCQSTGSVDIKADVVKVNRKGQVSQKELIFYSYKGSGAETLDDMFIDRTSDAATT